MWRWFDFHSICIEINASDCNFSLPSFITTIINDLSVNITDYKECALGGLLAVPVLLIYTRWSCEPPLWPAPWQFHSLFQYYHPSLWRLCPSVLPVDTIASLPSRLIKLKPELKPTIMLTTLSVTSAYIFYLYRRCRNQGKNIDNIRLCGHISLYTVQLKTSVVKNTNFRDNHHQCCKLIFVTLELSSPVL